MNSLLQLAFMNFMSDNNNPEYINRLKETLITDKDIKDRVYRITRVFKEVEAWVDIDDWLRSCLDEKDYWLVDRLEFNWGYDHDSESQIVSEIQVFFDESAEEEDIVNIRRKLNSNQVKWKLPLESMDESSISDWAQYR